MKVINLTPHNINLHIGDDVIKLDKSDKPARLDETHTDIGTASLNGKEIPIKQVIYSDPADMIPPFSEDTIYVVSALVAACLPHRTDLYFPGELVRDEQGQITGCRCLLKMNSEHPMNRSS